MIKLYNNGTDMTDRQLENLYEFFEDASIEYIIGERKEIPQWSGGILL
jgi:hypothetical protein